MPKKAILGMRRVGRRSMTGAAPVYSASPVNAATPSNYPSPSVLAYVAPTLPSLPAHATKTLDPTWGTYYTRITNGSANGHQYATHSPWNCDESYFWDAQGGSLLRTSDWSLVRSWSMPNDPIWAFTDTDKMWDVRNGNQFMYQSIATGLRSNIKTFSGYTGMRMGYGDGMCSWDDRYFLFDGLFGSQRRLMRWDKQTDTLVTRNITNTPNNYKMSPSGAYAVVNWESNNGSGSEQGVWLLDGSTLADIRQLTDDGDHGDVGKDINGNEIYVCSYNGSGSNPSGGFANIYAFRLDQSTSALDVGRLLPQTTGALYQQGHVSMQSVSRPGYAYLTTFKSSGSVPGAGQMLAVPTSGSAFSDSLVEVYGFTRSVSNITSGSDPAYDREPHACPNRDGTKVAIRSKWDTSDAVNQSYHAFILSAT